MVSGEAGAPGAECWAAAWTRPPQTLCAGVTRAKATPRPRERKDPGASLLSGRPRKPSSMHPLASVHSSGNTDAGEKAHILCLAGGGPLMFSSAAFWQCHSELIALNFLMLIPHMQNGNTHSPFSVMKIGDLYLKHTACAWDADSYMVTSGFEQGN